MDKFSGLKAATCIAAKNFERWSKLAALTSESSSVLHSITLLETSQLLSALLAELEAKDKRIAELEAKTAMTMGVGSGNGNLFVHGDYDSIKAAQAIVLENESLRAKLATPVRLPEGLAQKIKVTGYYEALNEMMDCVRAAGFKCVGDE